MLLKWPKHVEDALLCLWRDRYTATEIAEKLSAAYDYEYTRNAVLGKIYRLRVAGFKVAKRGSPLYNGRPMHTVNN